MKLIIAEKPSLARTIAKALGKYNSHTEEDRTGYLENDYYIITWAFGHLYTLKDVNDYLGKKTLWKDIPIPFIPSPFEYKVRLNKSKETDEVAKKQIKIIESFLKREDIPEVIHCGDSDREGQIIVDILLNLLNNKKDVKRLWLPEQTEETIRKGLKNLKENSSYENLKMEVYFEDKQNELKERTMKNKRYMMEQHIVPYFGNQMMSEITAGQIIQWQNEMQTKGFSEAYLRMIQNQLTSLYTHASKIYDLHANPCKKVKRMGSSDNRSLDFWTVDEYQKFIQTMEPGTRYYLIFEILFWTGCRIGELLALTPKDIDFDRNQFSITKTDYRTERQDVITEPKTKQSVRVVEIPEFLKQEIKDFVDRHYGMPEDERLFPIVQEAVQHKMKRQMEKAGVKKIRVHDLRHSHVAYLINKGVEPILIKERVGHKDIRITLNTYGHLYPNQQRKVADLLDTEKEKSPNSGNC